MDDLVSARSARLGGGALFARVLLFLLVILAVLVLVVVIVPLALVLLAAVLVGRAVRGALAGSRPLAPGPVVEEAGRKNVRVRGKATSDER